MSTQIISDVSEGVLMYVLPASEYTRRERGIAILKLRNFVRSREKSVRANANMFGMMWRFINMAVSDEAVLESVNKTVDLKRKRKANSMDCLEGIKTAKTV